MIDPIHQWKSGRSLEFVAPSPGFSHLSNLTLSCASSTNFLEIKQVCIFLSAEAIPAEVKFRWKYLSFDSGSS
jgi:hypothetical protein